ncbi:TrmH family RNA methyltransferase [Candidatus Phytoplasma palmae]|uniref:TrmH family RNA methyltransferase n=1 Tax=Candidatus Phytoplasma palmae TaxID=85624 RepID=UPI003990701B
MISSRHNYKFKKLKKLLLKKYRDKYQEFIVYGEHLIEEALKKKIVIELYSSSFLKNSILMKEFLFKELNVLGEPPFKIALCKICNIPLKNKNNNILVLDEIQNPQNAGVLLRSACAFNFNHVFFSKNSVDYYNEKTIRSSQGACFNLFLERGDIINFLDLKINQSYKIFSSCVYDKNINLNQLNSNFFKENPKRILIVGNEGSGISSEVKKKSHFFLNIKTTSVESLNVAVAGSILMYFLK